jgi:tetratricopeptide (TPR) repeat protein
MTARLITMLILLPFELLKGEEPRDPYQDVAPDLVRQVDLAKKKQDGSDTRQKDEAESLLLDVLKRKPDYYRALYNLGLIYLDKNEADKAVDVLTKAKGVRYKNNLRDDNAILNTLGWAYLNAGDLKQAEFYLKAAYDTKSQNDGPTNERILNNLGFLYLQEGKTTEARKFLDESKKQFNSSRANSILNLVSEYEQRQNQSQSSKEPWAVYGQRAKAGGEWSERHFNEIGKDKKATPRAGDIVDAFENVYVRTTLPVWDNNSNDFVHGAIVGYIKPGDRLQVLEVIDYNAMDANDDNAWYWIRFKRVSRK